MVIYISQSVDNTPTITGGGGTYAIIGTAQVGNVTTNKWFGAANITALSAATITVSGLSTFSSVAAHCISNAATSTPFDNLIAGANTSTAFNNAPVSLSFSTANADEAVIVGVVASSGGVLTVASTGYTIGQTSTANQDISTEYKVFSSTFTGTTGTMTLGSNNNWDVIVVGVKGPAGTAAHNMPAVVY